MNRQNYTYSQTTWSATRSGTNVATDGVSSNISGSLKLGLGGSINKDGWSVGFGFGTPGATYSQGETRTTKRIKR